MIAKKNSVLTSNSNNLTNNAAYSQQNIMAFKDDTNKSQMTNKTEMIQKNSIA